MKTEVETTGTFTGIQRQETNCSILLQRRIAKDESYGPLETLAD